MPVNPLALAMLAEGGLTDIDTTLFYSTLVLFIVFAGVLAKFAWGPLLKMIEEREKGIQDAVAGAEQANAEARSLLEEHKQMLREAGREREEIIKKAVREAEQLKSDLSERARSESAQILAKAKEQVEREKNLAIRELRSQVADLAIEAAAKIVQSSLTPEAQKKLVSDFISQMPKVQ
jgi:F-type H+-transporting ATPase subunit b